MDELDIYLGNHHVGTLAQSEGRLTFQYRGAWLEDPRSHPLSISLPLRAAPFGGEVVRRWFGNLLPEGDVLSSVARRLGRSTGDLFGLLADLGGECAGAVSLLPRGQRPEETGDYRRFSEEELYVLVAGAVPQPLLVGQPGVRLSLAGAQNKTPVYVDDGGIYRATATRASTHILKPPIRAAMPLAHTVENEAFCMQLAGSLGLNVPPAQVRTVREQSFYLVQRFDRVRVGARIERRHQEDFCQALGVEANLKYEESGGPTLAVIWQTLREQSAAPAVDGRQLLGWVGFNFLIGNADAHAKNIALLYGEDGAVRLAPFYDLLCTAVYPGLDQRLALHIGGERACDKLRRRHWEQLAEDLRIAPRAVFGELERLTRKIEVAATDLAATFAGQGDSGETIAALRDVIRQRVGRAWAFLGGRPD